MHTVGIIGASGYTGIEATRILSRHPGVRLTLATSDRWSGDTLEKRIGVMGALGKLTYAPLEKSEELGRTVDAVLLATPVDTSLALAPKLSAAGVRVIDLSGAFRLKNVELFKRYYEKAHPEPAALAQAVYGLPELFRDRIRGAKLVSNPGCYATAAELALGPLCKGGVLEVGPLIVDAASGVSGAGRKASEELSFVEVDEDFRAYRVLRHQHTPEISEVLATYAASLFPVTFTAHLLPVKRGILATCYGRLAEHVDPNAVTDALRQTYAAEPFVQVLDHPDQVSLKSVVGTNRCQIAAVCDPSSMDPRQVIVVSAIDNLIKGASGQAVQNLNLVLGLEETAGLAALGGFYP